MSKFLIAKYHFTFIGETFHRLNATGQNHYGILEYSLKTVQELYSILVALYYYSLFDNKRRKQSNAIIIHNLKFL